jgi:hypothetical protein
MPTFYDYVTISRRTDSSLNTKEKSKRKQDCQRKWEEILLEEIFLEEAVVIAVVATGIEIEEEEHRTDLDRHLKLESLEKISRTSSSMSVLLPKEQLSMNVISDTS